MKKNDEFELDIESISSEGSGVGHIDGLTVFVENAVPGDKIIAHVIKAKKNYCVAIIKKILKPSKKRIEIDCPAFLRCGGCSFRHIKYTEELEMKRKNVQDALNHIGGLDVEVKEILFVPNPDRYRNKGQYPIGFDADWNTVIGFYAKRSHRIIDCRDCLLSPKEFEPILNCIAKWSVIAGASVYNSELHTGLLRHIYLRKAHKTGQIMVCLVINGDVVPKLDLLVDSLLETDSDIASVVLNINKDKTNVILGGVCKTIFGSDYIEDILCGLTFRISPLSFFQVNPVGCEILYGKAREYANLQKDETLLDLYCGAGTIGLSMAQDCKSLIGVEIIHEAVENAKENAQLNGITNAEFFCSDAGEMAQTFEKQGMSPDCIILDPPRKGCSTDTINAVVRMNPKRIVYVSCDPATLARDCKLFSEYGYNITHATAVDMFPRTTHCESVLRLSRT